MQRKPWIGTPSSVSDFDLKTYLSSVCSGRWVEKALQLFFFLEWSATWCLLESPPVSSTPLQAPPIRFSWEVQHPKLYHIMSLAYVSHVLALDGLFKITIILHARFQNQGKVALKERSDYYLRR